MSNLRERIAALRASMKAPKPRDEKREKIADGAAPLLWCVLLTAVGVAALVGSTWMLLVFVAGSVGHVDWFSSYVAQNDGKPVFTWKFEATIHWLVGIGLFLFCAAIAIFNAVWLEARRHLEGLTKIVATCIGCAVALFMVSGAIVVQQKGTDARAQDAARVVQTAQAGVLAVQAEIDAIDNEMGRLCAPTLTTYQAQACRLGEEGWAERVAIARAQGSRNLLAIERAIADAKQGDRWRARLTELRGQKAVASVSAIETTTTQTVRADGWMATFTAFLEDARKPITAVLGELLAMTAFGLALSAWRTRRRHEDVVAGAVGGVWADEAHMVQDLREEPAIKRQRAEPLAQRVTDAETGEELVKIKPREYWRRTGGKRSKGPVAMDVGPPADVPADEKGAVFATDSRAARVEPTETSEEAIFGAPVQVESKEDDVRAVEARGSFGPDELEGGHLFGQREGDLGAGDQLDEPRHDSVDAGRGVASAPDLLILDASEEQIAALSEEPEPPEPGAVVQLPRGEGVMMDERAA